MFCFYMKICQQKILFFFEIENGGIISLKITSICSGFTELSVVNGIVSRVSHILKR